MAITQEITRISNAKSDIKTAIEAKGVSVPSDALIDTYDDYVAQISGGGNDDKAYISGLDLTGYPNNTIEAERFKDYVKLESIDTKAVTSAGKDAFKGCTSMTTANTPNLTAIPEGMFDGNPIELWVNSEHTTSVGKNAFRNTKMETIALRETTSIGDGGFYYDLTNDNKEVTIQAPSTPPTLGTNSLPTPIKEIQLPHVADIQTYTNDQYWSSYANKLVSYEQTITHYDFVQDALDGKTITWDDDPTYKVLTEGNTTPVGSFANDMYSQLYATAYKHWSLNQNKGGLYNGGSGARGLGFRQLFKDDVVIIGYVDNSGSDMSDQRYSTYNAKAIEDADGRQVMLCTENGAFSFTSYPRYRTIATIDINPTGYYPFKSYGALSDASWIPSPNLIDSSDTITINNRTLTKMTAGAYNGLYVDSANDWHIGSNGLYQSNGQQGGRYIGYKADANEYDTVTITVGEQGMIFSLVNLTLASTDNNTLTYAVDDPSLDWAIGVDPYTTTYDSFYIEKIELGHV